MPRTLWCSLSLSLLAWLTRWKHVRERASKNHYLLGWHVGNMSGNVSLRNDSTKWSKVFVLGHIYGHIWDYIFENHLQGEWRHILCIQWCTFVSQRWIQLSGGQNLLALLQPISSTWWVRWHGRRAHSLPLLRVGMYDSLSWFLSGSLTAIAI